MRAGEAPPTTPMRMTVRDGDGGRGSPLVLTRRLLPEVPSPHHLDGHDDGRRHDGQRLPLVENPIREPPRAVTPEWGDNPRTSPKPSDCGRHQFGAPRQRFDEVAIDLPGSDIAKR